MPKSKRKKSKKRKSMKKHSFRKLILIAGFLEGLWLAIGVNPKAEIFNLVSDFLSQLEINIFFILLLNVLPTLLLITTLVIIYRKGGKFGLVALVSAFLGGMLILVTPVLSLVFLGVGFGIGYRIDQKLK